LTARREAFRLGQKVGTYPGGFAAPTQRRAVILLSNPAAGGGAGAQVARQAVHTFAGLGHKAVLVSPPGPDAIKPAVVEALRSLGVTGPSQAILTAVGGDGTVRLAAEVAADLGVPLGIIPAGTGNGVAYSLGLPLDPWEACRVIATGPVVACDLGRIEFAPETGDRPTGFLNVAGAGLDAAITETYERTGLGLRGVPGYAVAALRSLASHAPALLDLTLDGRPLTLSALLVAVGNGPFYGKGIRIVPSAMPADGFLDVCVVLEVGLADLSTLVPLVLLGRHTGHPKVRTFRVREAFISPRPGATKPPLVQADGDLVGRLPARFSVIPGGVRLVSQAGADSGA